MVLQSPVPNVSLTKKPSSTTTSKKEVHVVMGDAESVKTETKKVVN